jgi:hypothetical protein
MQLNADWQADVAPASAAPPPMIEQQGWPEPPQVEHMPGVPTSVSRPPQPNPAVVHEPFPPVPQHA